VHERDRQTDRHVDGQTDRQTDMIRITMAIPRFALKCIAG